MNQRPTKLPGLLAELGLLLRLVRALVFVLGLVLLGLGLLGCHGSEVVVSPGPRAKVTGAGGAAEELHALRVVIMAELADVETALARGADEGLLDRRLLLTVALSELERRLIRPGIRSLDRTELLRLAEQRIAAVKEAETEPPGRPVYKLKELAIEGFGAEDDLAPEGEALDGLMERQSTASAVRQAAVVQDGGSSMPPEVQRALANQMGRVAPCLPPNESVRVTVRAQWFGEQLRGIALASEPPLVPAVSACLVDVLEAMRLPSSEGAMRVIVFPLAVR